MSQPIRFGPFEANLASGELWKNGQPVRIQEQPFQILATLLEQPGEVVTREQLRERLWPSDSFGDFDQGLNTAINKLREALGDSAADPKYIETLPKRGYRFTFARPPEPARVSPKRLPWIVVACLAGTAAGGLIGWTLRPAPKTELPHRRWTIRPTELIYPRIFTPGISISPDGRHIVVAAESSRGLWIHDLDQPQARLIGGTAGAKAPFWSPDSAMVAFAAGGALMKVTARGGAPVRLAALPGDGVVYGGAWSPDGESIVIAVGNPSQLYRVPARGGDPALLLSAEAARRAAQLIADRPAGYFWAPHFLPGGSRLAYSLGYLNPSVLVQDLKTSEIELLDQGSVPVYAASGYLLYTRPATYELWALPVSPGGQKAGESFRVAEKGILPSVSDDGTLVYIDAPYEQLAWFDRQGKRQELLGQAGQGVYYPAISPDGRRIAMETLENANLDIWVLDLDRGSRIRLTSHRATDIVPVWSPAGDIAFSSYRSGSIGVWLRRADAGSGESLIHGTPANERVSDWSKDGRYILCSVVKDGQGDIHYLARGEDGKWESHSFLATPASELVAKLSPDGRYAAYLSDESGRMELYVRGFPNGDRKWVLSSHGASQPRWSRDGKEIFYSETGTLIAVPVTTVPEFSARPPVRLFAHPALARWESEPHYDVSADRQRFLLPEPVGGNDIRIHVVQNWLAAFPERAGR